MNIQAEIADGAWSQFFQMIQRQFPNSVVHGLAVKGGVVHSYEFIDATQHYASETQRDFEDGMNSQWIRFVHACRQMGDGLIQEAHFRDGNPRFCAIRYRPAAPDARTAAGTLGAAR